MESPTPAKRKVFLVDDHPMVREHLAQLINREPDLEICGEAEDAADALSGIAQAQPDIAIVDISLKKSHGLELIKNVHAIQPELPILVLSMHDESLYAERVLRAGALGYMTKQEATRNVLTALRRVLDGQIYASEKIAARLMKKAVSGQAESSPTDALTDRELEVFQLLGKGLRSREIAQQLNISIKSVDTYRARIKDKLNVRNSTELLLQALQWVHQVGHN